VEKDLHKHGRVGREAKGYEGIEKGDQGRLKTTK
jgi:hypothetical protein